jgi:hypothetical protein
MPFDEESGNTEIQTGKSIRSLDLHIDRSFVRVNL